MGSLLPGVQPTLRSLEELVFVFVSLSGAVMGWSVAVGPPGGELAGLCSLLFGPVPMGHLYLHRTCRTGDTTP